MILTKITGGAWPLGHKIIYLYNIFKEVCDDTDECCS